MKNRILSVGLAALSLAASAAAYADAHVRVDLNPFGFWGPAPPVVYEPPRYYAPPAVYVGRGHYGEHHDRGRYDRGRPEHRDDDRRR
jgi:hypothetical protein